MKRRLSEYVSLGFVYTSTGFTIGILFLILFYIIWNGIFYNNQKEYEVTSKTEKEMAGLYIVVNKGTKVSDLPYNVLKGIFTDSYGKWKKISDSTSDIYPSVSIEIVSQLESMFGEKVGLLVEKINRPEEVLRFTAGNRGGIGILDKNTYEESIKKISSSEKKQLKLITIRSIALLCNRTVTDLYGNSKLERINENKIQNILNGKYLNWKELGGPDLPIVVFQQDEFSTLEQFSKKISETPGAVALGEAYLLKNSTNSEIESLRIVRTEKGINLKPSFLFTKPIDGGRSGGISSIILNTVIMIILTMSLTIPPGLFAAIYLVEYAKEGPIMRIIRLGTETLAGIPSIIFGLFGMLVFVEGFGWGISLISGSFTLLLMILPTIVRTSEEALKAVSPALKEGSLALGATKIQTIFKVVLPAAFPAIISGIILAIGRALGETAALIYTMGSNYNLTSGLTDSTRTLSVHLYLLIAEGISTDKAFASGTILVILIFAINYLSRKAVEKMTIHG